MDGFVSQEIGLQGTGQHRKENCQELFNPEHAQVCLSFL